MATTTDYDYLFKILVVGESGVGKSCLLLRYSDDTFTNNFISTVGVDFKFKRLEIDGKSIKLQIWDTAGQERFRTITESYYRGAHGVLLVFDLTDINSFLKTKNWLEQINQHAPNSVCIALVGNKSDLEEKRAVSFQEATAFANQHSLPYSETSAKDGKGVKEIFLQLTEEIHKAVASGKLDHSKKKNQGVMETQQTSGGCSC